jgi:hypothetical protein
MPKFTGKDRQPLAQVWREIPNWRCWTTYETRQRQPGDAGREPETGYSRISRLREAPVELRLDDDYSARNG